MNKVILQGRLTADPELRYTPSGVAMTTFTMAVNRRFKNSQTGEREADFIRCIAWRQAAELAANQLRKGARVAIVGSWQTGSYEGQDGKRNYTNDCNVEEIDLIDFATDAQQNNTTPGANQPQQQGQPPRQQQNNQPSQQQNYSQQNQPQNQQNYTRMDEDPFANSKGPIEVNEDDLPF